MSIWILASHNYKNNITEVKQLLRSMWWRAAKYCACVWNGLQNTRVQWNSRWGRDSTVCVCVCVPERLHCKSALCSAVRQYQPAAFFGTQHGAARQDSLVAKPRTSRCDSRIHTWAHDIIRCCWYKQNHKLKMMIFLLLRGTEGGFTCSCVLASETVFYFYHREVHYF